MPIIGTSVSSEQLFLKLSNILTDKKASLKRGRVNKICVLY